MTRYRPRRLLQLVFGCVVLGVGVGLLLAAKLGSDGYSTLVNGVAHRAEWPFSVANLVIGVVLLLVAAARRVLPGLGTVVQVVVVGVTVSVVLDLLDTPPTVTGRVALLVLAIPVVAIGVALYLSTGLGAGPAEGAAQAWDPPLPFRWSYSALQGFGALVGWLLGASIGVGTIVVILLVGPAVDVAARVLRVDLSATRTAVPDGT